MTEIPDQAYDDADKLTETVLEAADELGIGAASSRAAVASGLLVPVAELVFDEQVGPWLELAAALPPIGWKPAVRWLANDLDIVWVPPGTTRRQADECAGPEVHVCYGSDLADRGAFVCYLRYLTDEDDDPGVRWREVGEVLAWIRGLG